MKIPLIGRQILPARRKSLPHELVTYLASQNFLDKGRGRWDVIRMSAAGRSRHGDAIILANYLDMVDANGQLVWLGWSKRHPERARRLWPAVREAAELQAYELIPRIFELSEHAAQANDDQVFRKTLAREYAMLAEELSDANQHQRAEQLRTLSHKYDRPQSDV